MGIYKNIILYNFSDNHDVDRVSSKLKNKMYLFPLYAMLFTMPGVPSIYYGSEWGIEGVKNNGSDNSLRPYIDINTIKDNVEGLRQWISKLIKIRKNNIALKLGNYKQLHINHQQFVFERFFSGEEIVVAFNSSDVYSKINVSKNGKYLDLISENKTFISNNGSLSIEIEPFSALILKKM
jgi:glycosidase